MQAIIIVMLLTYTSLFKIIKISLKNNRLASARKAVALPKHNIYIPIKVGHGGSSTANTYMHVR